MNIKKYWIMLAIALVSLCTISCGGDDDEEGSSKDNPVSVNDPEGTIIVNLSNYGHSSHGQSHGNLIDFSIDNTWMYSLAMNSSNNLFVYEGITFYSCYQYEIYPCQPLLMLFW